MLSNFRRPTSRTLAVVAVVATLGIGAAVIAQAQQPPNRSVQLIKYRQALFTVMSRDFGWMNQVARDKAPYDAAEVLKRAKRVEVLVGILPEAFPADSQGEGTKAKPEIWTDTAEFERLLKEFQTRSANLTQVASGGAEADVKAAIKSMGEVCGQCHEKFKAKN